MNFLVGSSLVSPSKNLQLPRVRSILFTDCSRFQLTHEEPERVIAGSLLESHPLSHNHLNQASCNLCLPDRLDGRHILSMGYLLSITAG